MIKNVMYINEVSFIGGAENSLISILRNLDRNKFNPAIVLLPNKGLLLGKIKKLGIEVEFINYCSWQFKNPLRFLQTHWQLISSVLKNKIDVIHLNHHYLIDYAVRVAKITNRPLVCHFRGIENKNFMKEKSRYLKKADTIIAVSNAVAGNLRKFGIDSSKIKVVYNDVNIRDAEKVDSALFGKEFNIENKTILIGIVGQIVPEKGLEDFLYASKIVASHIENVKFMIVGEDTSNNNYLEYLMKLAKDLNLDKKIVFTGFKNDIFNVLKKLDLLVVASWQEALGRSILEAMAVDTLVVATNVGGIPEIITDMDNGILTQAHNSTDLADKIMLALNLDKKTKSIMLEKAKNTINEKFNAKKNIKKIEQIYNSLI